LNRVRGILVLLIAVIVFSSVINPQFLLAYNLQNILRWTGLFGILSIGAGLVIITGGIDLSIGSVVGIAGTTMAMWVGATGMSPGIAFLLAIGLSVGIGFAQGLLITKLRLQPFIVTLCGLLILRGVSRYVTGDATQGFGSKHLWLRNLASESPISIPIPGIGPIAIPWPFILLIILAIIAGIFLNRSVYGRHLLALGRNEEATRISGVNTQAIIIATYVISATLAGFGGILFALDINSVQPSGHGEFYELYAIAAAVLGGCSLRGGEGTILGMVIGTAIIRVLYNAINVLGIATQLEYAVIGAVILLGVIADELVRRMGARRAAKRVEAQ
jgi:ribose transport system permease protein